MAAFPSGLPDGDGACGHAEPESVWEQLLHDARAGEPLALNELIETWRTYLFFVAESEISSDLRQKVGVSDLVQSACLDVFLRFEDFRGKTVDEWRGWLKRLMLRDLQDARRRFVSTQRRDVRRERSLERAEWPLEGFSDARPSPNDRLIADEESAALRMALVKLPEDYRLVLRLRNWEGLTFAEVGRRMNRTEEASRKLWSRAILRLQQELSEGIA